MDEREIFADFLAGTPIDGDAGELDRLIRADGTLARLQVVSVIRARQADSVAKALSSRSRPRHLNVDVRHDADAL